MGLSLRSVATAVGISASMLSQVETGKLNPSVATLYEIALYLDVSIDSLLGLKTSKERLSEIDEDILRLAVQRVGTASVTKLSEGVTAERLISRPDNRFEPTLVTFAPGTTGPRGSLYNRHKGGEFAYIIDGSLKVQLGTQETILNAGDSVYFDADVPHLFTNESTQKVRGVWIISEFWHHNSETDQIMHGQPPYTRLEALDIFRTDTYPE